MPQIDPPAINPELNNVPELSSDSSWAPVARSTHHRVRPPTKIGAVVAIGRYDPTANDNEWIPQSSSVTEMKMPTSTRPHGRFWLRRPLMMVDIRVACGAAMGVEPIRKTAGGYRVVMR